MSDVIQAIVISDTHIGCKLGLCPPAPQKLDDGGTYKPSILQKKVWNWWVEFWHDWVPQVTRGGDFAVIVNGDIIDGEHHGVTTTISNNITDQSRIAKKVFEPIVAQCKGKFYMVRGTEVHAGKSAQYEEAIAESLGAIPDEEGNYARWEMWARIGSGLAHISHHIGITGSLAYETTALMKEYTEACSDAGRWNREAPSVLVRSHRHRYSEIRVPIENGYGITICTPAWQLKTPLTYRLSGARLTTPQFGGILIKAGDEDRLYTRSKVWTIVRTKIEEL